MFAELTRDQLWEAPTVRDEGYEEPRKFWDMSRRDSPGSRPEAGRASASGRAAFGRGRGNRRLPDRLLRRRPLPSRLGRRLCRVGVLWIRSSTEAEAAPTCHVDLVACPASRPVIAPTSQRTARFELWLRLVRGELSRLREQWTTQNVSTTNRAIDPRCFFSTTGGFRIWRPNCAPTHPAALAHLPTAHRRSRLRLALLSLAHWKLDQKDTGSRVAEQGRPVDPAAAAARRRTGIVAKSGGRDNKRMMSSIVARFCDGRAVTLWLGPGQPSGPVGTAGLRTLPGLLT